MTEKDKQKNKIKLCIDFICMFAAAVIAGCLVKEGVAAAAGAAGGAAGGAAASK